MSKIRKDLIWREEEVLPYIKNLAKSLGYVSSVHLVGSRGKGREVADGKDVDYEDISSWVSGLSPSCNTAGTINIGFGSANMISQMKMGAGTLYKLTKL